MTNLVGDPSYSMLIPGRRHDGAREVLVSQPAEAARACRRDPLLLSVEGNTSLAGFSRNGLAVDLKQVSTERVLGYVHPSPGT